MQLLDIRNDLGAYGPCLSATVEDGGQTFGFSRYPDEKQWLCDSHFGRNSYPHFCHGVGSRCCIKSIASDEVAQLLDNAAAGMPAMQIA